MALIKTPYEILIRYDMDGALQGAHVQWLVRDSDGAIPPQQGSVQSLSLTGTDEFALPTILGQSLADALAANSDLRSQIAALQDQLDSSL